MRKIIKGGVVLVEATDDTPKFVLDPHKNTILIEGSSFPEDAVEFYSYIILWIAENKDNFTGQLKCVFDYTILSSASNKMVFEILVKLENLQDEIKVLVHWLYSSFDEDMYDEGKAFKDTLKLPFEIIEKDTFN